MKTFFNVVGLLACWSGLGALLLVINSTDRLLGSVALLLGCTAFGFAKLIELAQGNAAAARAHEAKVVGLLKSIANGQPVPTVTAPAIPRWMVDNGAEVMGAFTASQLRALREKNAITDESKVAPEGTQDWQPYAKALAGA